MPRSSAGLRVLAAFLAWAGPATAQDTIDRTDRQLWKDVHSLTREDKTFDENAPAYLDLFRQNSFDGLPGLSQRDREVATLQWLAGIRAKAMADYIERDLDGDLNVTRAELRAGFVARAYLRSEVRRRGRFNTVEAAEEWIDEQVDLLLRHDLNGDGTLSFDEIRVVVEDLVLGAENNMPVRRMTPSRRHDTDGDGTISEAEFLALAASLFAGFDTNGDGVMSAEERVATQPGRGEIPLAFRPGISRREALGYWCPFPTDDADLPYYVVGGFEGAAMSDLYLGDRPEPTEIVDLRVPPEGRPFRLIASFSRATLLRVDDRAGRLRSVLVTRGEVATIGAPRARLVRTDPTCHVDLWKPVSSTVPDPVRFYTPLVGRAPVGVVSGYSLGQVDLESVTNTPRRAFSGALSPDITGPQGVLWTHFLRFNPGGLVLIDPDSVRATLPVRRHLHWPQWAGLAQLADSGALEILPRDGTRGAGRSRGPGTKVTIEGRTFSPGGGDDAITVDGLRYTEEFPGRWVGRRPLELLVKAPFTFPAGLSGAHAVTFVLPPDAPPPGGDRGQSRIVRQDPNQTLTAE